MKNLSLRTRITLPIILLIIVGMVITATISTRSTSTLTRNNIMERLDETTESMAAKVSTLAKTLERDNLTLSENEVLTNLTHYQHANSAVYTKKGNAVLKAFVERYDDYLGAFLINAEGIAIAAHDPDLVGSLNLAERDYFKKVLDKRQLVISNALKSTSTGKPIIVVAMPIIIDDQVAAVTVTTLNMERFTEKAIAPIKIGEEGNAYMTDSTGLMAADKNPDAVLSMKLGDFDWGKQILKQKNGSITYTFEGVEKLVNFRTEPSTGWVIAAAATTDDIFGGIKDMTRNTVIVNLFVIILLGIVIFLIVRPISAALNKGVAFAKEIQQGDLSNRLNLDTKDEIGQLGTALDDMADSLQDRAELAEAIAAGDLTREVTLASEQDALGRALRTMTERLNDILGQISIAGEQIDTGSNQVSDSAQDLSQGSTQQASAIEEIGASLSELSGRTQTNAENAASANQLASSASSAAKDGSAQMQQMVTAMVEINESGKNISKIIKTIDEIAFQTNLLALNAAVEAARAGQHGKGFAVVAEEVRNLAARSAKAAQETADLIEGSVQKGQNGTTIAERTAKALEEIVGGIGKTSDLIAEIAASSKEQAEGLSQVSDGLAQVDQVVQRNTAGAEESAAAAEELSSQSSYLIQLIGQFRLKGHVATAVSSAPTQRPAAKPAALAAPQQARTAAPAPAAQTSGWGQATAKGKPVIALDDDEFGKY
jgi:methyl-accepting chemotaxis protein